LDFSGLSLDATSRDWMSSASKPQRIIHVVNVRPSWQCGSSLSGKLFKIFPQPPHVVSSHALHLFCRWYISLSHLAQLVWKPAQSSFKTSRWLSILLRIIFRVILFPMSRLEMAFVNLLYELVVVVVGGVSPKGGSHERGGGSRCACSNASAGPIIRGEYKKIKQSWFARGLMVHHNWIVEQNNN